MGRPHFSPSGARGSAEMTEKSKCIWTKWHDPDGDTVWNTTCGEDFTLLEQGPADNHYYYCPTCGNKIVERESNRKESKP